MVLNMSSTVFAQAATENALSTGENVMEALAKDVPTSTDLLEEPASAVTDEKGQTAPNLPDEQTTVNETVEETKPAEIVVPPAEPVDNVDNKEQAEENDKKPLGETELPIANSAPEEEKTEAEPLQVSSIADARKGAKDVSFTVQGVITAIDGKNVFVQDSSGGICIYLQVSNTALKVGNEVTATGKKDIFNGLDELKLAANSDLSVIQESASLPGAISVDKISEIGENLEGKRIQLSDAVIGIINEKGDTPLTKESSTIIIRKLNLQGCAVKEGDTIDITAVVGQYNTDYQLFVGNAADDIVVKTEALPRVEPVTAFPVAGAVEKGTTVKLATTTAEAKIQYKLGSEGVYTDYTVPIVINETVTIFAKASKAEMRDSFEALFYYTVDVPSTIAAARAEWVKNPTVDTNKLVKVTGIVNFLDGKSITIQDDEAGICVRLSKSSTLKPALGDKMTAEGYLSEYNGLIQLNPQDSKVTIDTHNNQLPKPVSVTLAELSDAAKAEQYESRRIWIKGAVLGEINTGANTLITQGSSSMNMFKIPDPQPLKQGDLVNVIGVLGQFNTYQIRVANAQDIMTALHVVISEVYGAGGNAGSYYKNDYIELYNPTTKDVDLTGWSVQYASKAGTGFKSYALSGAIKAGKYYLIQCGGEKNGTAYLESPDHTSSSISMGGGSGVVALSSSTAIITGKDDPAVIDLVGYGSEAKVFEGAGPTSDTGGNLQSHQRKDNDGGMYGATNGYDTNDNKNDFYPAECSPRNSSFVYVDAPTVTLAPFYEGEYGKKMDVKILKAESKESTIKAIAVAISYQDSDTLVWSTYPVDGNLSKVENLVKQVDVLPKSSTDRMTIHVKAQDAAGNYSRTNAQAKVKIKNLPAVESYAPMGGVGKNSKPDILVKVANSTKYDIKVFLMDNVTAPKELIKFENCTETEVKGSFAEPLADGLHNMKAELTDKSIENHTYTFVQEWTFRIGEETYKPFFGQLHAHTAESDGKGTLDEAYSWARDKANLDFIAITDHSNNFMDKGSPNRGTTESCLNAKTVEATGNDNWIRLHQIAEKYNKPNDPVKPFVALAGYEMTWGSGTSSDPYILNGKKMAHGHINTFNTPWFANRDDPNMQYMEKYYDKLASDTLSVSQFNHPGTTFGTFKEFGSYQPEYDNVINLLEVGNGEGPIHGSGYFPSYNEYNKALDKGWHVAPTNNQDNHKEKWGTANDARSVVLAPALSREEVMNAMRQRHVYATEDKNLTMSYVVNGEIMGTILNNPTNLAVDIKLSDPDQEPIGKISIITNGGKTVAIKNVSESSAEWKLELKADKAYYYVRVDQPDKDIAVSAPVWTGKKTAAGVTNIAFEDTVVEPDKTVKLNVQLFKSDADSSIVVDKLDVWEDKEQGTPLWSQTINEPMTGSEFSKGYDFATGKSGKKNYIIKVTLNIDGAEETFNRELSLSVLEREKSLCVMVDAAHRNNYVSGYYNGQMTALKRLVNQKNIFFVENKQKFTDDVLKNVDLLILSDPCTRDIKNEDKEKVKYTQSEIDAIKNYMDQGGNLIMSSQRDSYDIAGDKAFSKDYQLNQILEPIGSALRANDDTVCQGSADDYRMYYNRYGESPKYNLTANIDTILDGEEETIKKFSSYAGASLYVDESSKNKENVEVLVNLFDDCFQVDKDGDGDIILKEGDKKFSLAAEVLPKGGRLVVGGSTFYSDFEINGTSADTYSNAAIVQNILSWMLYHDRNITIADIQRNANNMQGEYVEIRGRVTAQSGGTSQRLGHPNSFFDVMYIQDETGGITVFGVSNRDIPLGTEVIVKGFVDQYLGDVEIQLEDEQTGITVLNSAVRFVEPKKFACKEIKNSNIGWFAQVQGRVVQIDNQNIYLDDGTGKARIYVEGYIGSSSGKNKTGKWSSDIKVGSIVSACGLISVDPEGIRLRVRDTDEIVLVPDTNSTNSANHNNSNNDKIIENVMDKLTSAPSNANVNFYVGENYAMPTSFLNDLLKNKGKTVTLSGDWYEWIFAGENIENNMPGVIYFDCRISTESPNKKAIDKLAGRANVTNLYFHYHGELPGKTKIRVKLENEANKTLHLYYFNKDINKLELVQSGIKVDKDGWADFTITHCSDYILSEKPIAGAVKAKKALFGANPETGGMLTTPQIALQENTVFKDVNSEKAVHEDNAKQSNGTQIKSAEVESKNSSTVFWIILFFIGSVTVGSIILLKRKSIDK